MTATPQFLILGATGSIGYAVTANLLARQLPVTILVRDRHKAARLFPDAPTLNVVEGDAQHAGLLRNVVAGKTHIVHGINYRYDQWFGNMDVVTQTLIDVVTPDQQLVFPGNVYNFGNQVAPIREDSRPDPCTRKGGLRVALEAMLQRAAEAGRCTVLTVRLPDFWGPNVLNDGVRPIFENALRGKPLPWLLNADLPHQAVYTPDAAEVIVRLMLRAPAQPYEVWQYGGQTFPSMRWFFGQIARQTGHPLRVRVYSRLFIRLLGLVLPVLREVDEMRYLYENTVRLDDTKLRTAYPDLRETPLSDALATTLAWFASVPANRPLSPLSDTAATTLLPA